MCLQRNPGKLTLWLGARRDAGSCQKNFFDIILYTRHVKLFWVRDTPIGGAKSALAAHRHFTRLPNNRTQVRRSLDVKHCMWGVQVTIGLKLERTLEH